VGDVIWITNADGKLSEAEIIIIEKRKCVAQIKHEKNVQPTGQFTLHVAVGIAKHADRWEWMIEKLTELGVSEITPLITERTEKKKVNEERLHKLMLSAMKQSTQCWLPKLNEPIEFKKFVEKQHKTIEQKLIAHNENQVTVQLSSQFQAQQSSLLLIGPEGGFAEQEFTLAQQNNFSAVLLGNSRLRLETASIAAVSFIQLKNSR
jgi:16S rRNA (uracil1498-N3)-methyltransferase